MTTSRTVVGVVLAGGASRRMGRDKAGLVDGIGRSLAARVAATLDEVCDDVIVAGGAPPADLAALTHVPDRRAGLGPLAGIDAALASGLGSRYLVCPCDLPRLTATVLAALRDAHGSLAVLHLAGEERVRPLPLAIDVDLADVVRRQLDHGRYAVHELIDVANATVVTAPAEWRGWLANVNTPADAAALGLRSK